MSNISRFDKRLNKIPQLIIHDMSPYDVPFFCDFMLFLERLSKQAIKRTVTGLISLTDISDLMKQFKEQEQIEEYKKFGWSLRRESELGFLTQIKLIADVMFITYNRKGLLLLSKNGRGFLKNLDVVKQYKEMVLHYWYKVNWGYFTPGRTVNDFNLAETLQHYQTGIWKVLLENGSEWIDYKQFCYMLYEQLHLDLFIDDEFGLEHNFLFELDLILFKRNLQRFGCVDVVEGPSRYDWDKEIVKFRSTPLGLDAYHKALFKNYL